jgi:hypothetical protein
MPASAIELVISHGRAFIGQDLDIRDQGWQDVGKSSASERSKFKQGVHHLMKFLAATGTELPVIPSQAQDRLRQQATRQDQAQWHQQSQHPQSPIGSVQAKLAQSLENL